MTVHVIPYAECPDSRYHADDFADVTDGQPTLSSTCGSTLRESPLNAWALHPRLGNKATVTPWTERKKSTRLGSIMHGLMLECMDEFAVASDEHSDWRTKAAREFRDQALEDGLLPILQHELEAAQVEATALAGCLASQATNPVYLADGHTELTIIYRTETEHGPIWVRTRLDHVDLPTITDLKTRSGSFANGALLRAIQAHGYHVQAAAYMEAALHAWPELEGRLTYQWAFLQLEPLPDALVVRPDGAILEAGRQQWERAKNLWAKCLRDNHWPGHGHDRTMVHSEAWFMAANGL